MLLVPWMLDLDDDLLLQQQDEQRGTGERRPDRATDQHEQHCEDAEDDHVSDHLDQDGDLRCLQINSIPTALHIDN